MSDKKITPHMIAELRKAGKEAAIVLYEDPTLLEEVLDAAEVMYGDPQEYLTRHGVPPEAVAASLEELTGKIDTVERLQRENKRLQDALDHVLASAVPDARENPTMAKYWAEATKVLAETRR